MKRGINFSADAQIGRKHHELSNKAKNRFVTVQIYFTPEVKKRKRRPIIGALREPGGQGEGNIRNLIMGVSREPQEQGRRTLPKSAVLSNVLKQKREALRGEGED